MYTLYSRGKGVMNIHTSKCTFFFCLFLPENKRKKSVKDVPFTASTFTNVQLYRQNKSITTNLEQGLSNTKTRHIFSSTNFTLINCTYTTCHLQFIWSKEVIAMSITGELYSFQWPPTGLQYILHLHTQPINNNMNKNLYILTEKPEPL